MAVVSNVT